MKNIIVIAILVLLLTTPGYSATYYVNGTSGLDTNPGTITNPWKTIYKANQTLVAGDTVYIRAGTYSIGASESSNEGINPRNSGTDATHRITYATYQNEAVNFVGNDAYSRGINIANKNWIKIAGYDGSTSSMNMKFSNCDTFLWIGDGQSGGYPYGIGSNYNEIGYCEFAQTNSTVIITGGYRSSTIWRNSSYNWVHHCTFRDMGGYPPGTDAGVGIDLGYDDCGLDSGDNICHDTTSNNIIENTTFYHNGHHTIGILNTHNVVRNNNFHNEQFWKAADNIWYGYRTLMFSGTYNNDYHHAYNLVEGNKISHSSSHYMNTNTTGVQLSNADNIIRYNDIYANANFAFYIETHNETYGKIGYNHIYNNTFMANGYGALLPDATNPANASRVGAVPERSLFYTTVRTESNWDDMAHGNVIKNNLFWKNYNTTFANNFTRSYSAYGGYNMDTCGAAHNERCGGTVLEPNFNGNVATPIDPKFTSEGAYGNPVVNNTDKEWYWGATAITGQDITTVKTQPTLTLQSSSPAIDQGTYLTRAVGSGSGNTSLVVADAKYFQPGWGNGAGGGASVAADWIAIGTVSNTVQISSINYGTNTITLAAPMTWSNGASVWLYKDSNEQIVLSGQAPDMGAHETAISPPSGLRIIN